MVRSKTDYRRAFDLRSSVPLKRKQVDEVLLSIWHEHSDRLRSSYVGKHEFGLSKNEDAKNFLRREIYALGLALRRAPPKWNVAELIASSRAHQTTRMAALENQIFHALLMGVYEDDDLIPRQERWMMSRELEYAYRHGVAPEFLCGFLFQSGGRKNLRKKLKAGYIEPCFRPPAQGLAP